MPLPHSLRICTLIIVFVFWCDGLLAQSHNEAPDTRIVLFSDLNESYGSTHYGPWLDSALHFVDGLNPDIILNAGDVVAGQSLKLTEENIREMWESFDDFVAKPLREKGIPFINAVGNHDGSGSGNFDHEREIMREYLSRHTPELNYLDDADFPFNFTFMVNDIFVLSLDASTHQISEAQRKWMNEQLDSESATNASLKIAIGHLPLYAIAEGRNTFGNVISDPEYVLQLFKEKKVDFYLSGHHHAYYPAEKEGVILLAAGAIGGGPRQLLGSDIPPKRTLTVLDFWNDDGESKSFTITTYDIEKNFRLVESNSLPDHLEGINGTIYRYDH